MTAASVPNLIVVERTLSAPPDVVFAAWSDARSLSQWMCPGSDRQSTVDVDFRVGGRFNIVMHGTDNDYRHEGEYVTIEPPRELVFTWVSTWMPDDVATTLVRVQLEPVGDDRTQLRLIHEQIRDQERYAHHAEGWRGILDKLERLAQRGIAA